MLYELRYYEVTAQPVMAGLHKLFADHGVGLLQKHGIGVLGFWKTTYGDWQHVPCVLTFEDMADREAKLETFESDPEWLEAKAEADSTMYGPMVASTSSILLRPTSYSPEPQVTRAVHEFRINQAMPGRIEDLHHLFEHNHQATLFPRHDIRVVGWFDEVVGTTDRIFFILEFVSAAAGVASWTSLINDPEFKQCSRPYETKGYLRKWAGNRLYRLMDYSPRHPDHPVPAEGAMF